MGIARLQTSFGRIFRQRCFYLFASLIALLAAGPFVEELPGGRVLMGAMHVLVLIAAVAAVGRTTMPFVIALLLGIPAVGFQMMGILGQDEPVHGAVVSGCFYLAFYLAALIYLLRYS